MKYISSTDIKTILNTGKVLEYWIGAGVYSGFPTLKWLSIEKHQTKYHLIYHHVFDDRDEGVESLYNFSDVDPNEVHGTFLLITEDFDELMIYMKNHFQVDDNKFLFADNLNEFLNNQ